jgi:hypothetical protein
MGTAFPDDCFAAVLIGQKTPAGRDSDGNPFHTTSKPLRRVGKYARQEYSHSTNYGKNGAQKLAQGINLAVRADSHAEAVMHALKHWDNLSDEARDALARILASLSL